MTCRGSKAPSKACKRELETDSKHQVPTQEQISYIEYKLQSYIRIYRCQRGATANVEPREYRRIFQLIRPVVSKLPAADHFPQQAVEICPVNPLALDNQAGIFECARPRPVMAIARNVSSPGDADAKDPLPREKNEGTRLVFNRADNAAV